MMNQLSNHEFPKEKPMDGKYYKYGKPTFVYPVSYHSLFYASGVSRRHHKPYPV